MDNNLHMY